MLTQGAQHIAGPQLAGLVQLGDQPTFHLQLFGGGDGLGKPGIAQGQDFRLADGGLQGLVQHRLVDLEPRHDRGAQGLTHPGVELLGHVFRQARMAGQGRAHGGDLPRGLDQLGHVRGGDVGGVVGSQGRHHGGRRALDDARHHRRADAGPAGDLDLVIDGGLHQQLDQIQVAQHRAGGDDWAGDVDVVVGQGGDQRMRRPGCVGELFGQGQADVLFGARHKAH